jgi:hypothetical protein
MYKQLLEQIAKKNVPKLITMKKKKLEKKT